MGGSSRQTQQTRQVTQPWAAAQPALDSILANVGTMAASAPLSAAETGALDTLAANAAAGNPYAAPLGSLASDLLAGGPDRSGLVNDAYARLQSQLGATAAGDYLDPAKNPFFNQTTQAISNDVQSRLAGMYAGAGRDPAGAASFGGELGQRIAAGTAPVFADAYNTERQNQLSAMNALFGAGSQTANLLAGFDRAAMANRQAGIAAADAALNAQNYGANQALAVEAQRRGIPLNALTQLANIVTPIARLGSTTEGMQTTTNKQAFNPLSLVPLFTGGRGAGAAGGLGAAANGIGSGIGSALSGFGSAASSILGSLPFLFSDARMKEDLAQVGTLHDGTPVYSYTYIGDPTPRIGLLAQDVERRRPDAVAEIGGRKAVDYRKATARARAIGGLLDNLADL